jgi:hypothetical protein
MRYIKFVSLIAALTIALGTTAIAEGNGPGGSEGGIEGAAQSARQGGENGAEIDHSENTGSGIVKGHAADTGPGNPDAPQAAPSVSHKKL